MQSSSLQSLPPIGMWSVEMRKSPKSLQAVRAKKLLSQKVSLIDAGNGNWRALFIILAIVLSIILSKEPEPSPATQPSGEPQEQAKFANLQIAMAGVNPLDSSAVNVWQEVTAEHYSNFYKNQPQYGISNLVSVISVVEQDPPQNRRRGLNGSRNLQNQELELKYDQTISYDKSSDSTLTPQDVIVQPLASDTAREAYVNQLRDSGDAVFADITCVTGVSQAVDPTQAPSAAVTQPSGEPQEPAKFANLQITMTGVNPLDSSAELVWVKETANHYSNFYKNQPQYGISNLVSVISVVEQDPPQNRRRGLNGSRNLQNQELELKYDQTISYDKSSDSTLTPQDVIAQPFASDTAREAYVNQLRDSGDAVFADITSVMGVSQAEDARTN